MLRLSLAAWRVALSVLFSCVSPVGFNKINNANLTVGRRRNNPFVSCLLGFAVDFNYFGLHFSLGRWLCEPIVYPHIFFLDLWKKEEKGISSTSLCFLPAWRCFTIVADRSVHRGDCLSPISMI